jgi:hypothetical protein
MKRVDSCHHWLVTQLIAERWRHYKTDNRLAIITNTKCRQTLGSNAGETLNKYLLQTQIAESYANLTSDTV